MGTDEWLDKEKDFINDDCFNHKDLNKVFNKDLSRFINTSLESYRNYFLAVDESEDLLLDNFIGDIVEFYPNVERLKLIEGNNTCLIVCIGDDDGNI